VIWIVGTHQNGLDPQHKGRSKGREKIIIDEFFWILSLDAKTCAAIE
jgi:hypothetical protein